MMKKTLCLLLLSNMIQFPFSTCKAKKEIFCSDTESESSEEEEFSAENLFNLLSNKIMDNVSIEEFKDLLNFALSQNFDLNQKEEEDMEAEEEKETEENTLLHYAVEYAYIEGVNLLLVNGANINAQNIYGATPLHRALNLTSVEVVKTLLYFNPNIQIKDEDGRTAFHEAARSPNKEMTQVLIHYAKSQHLDIYKLLACKDGFDKTPVDYEIEERIFDEDGWTYFHGAAYDENKEVTQFIMHHSNLPNLDINDKENWYKTPINYEIEEEEKEKEIFSELYPYLFPPFSEIKSNQSMAFSDENCPLSALFIKLETEQNEKSKRKQERLIEYENSEEQPSAFKRIRLA